VGLPLRDESEQLHKGRENMTMWAREMTPIINIMAKRNFFINEIPEKYKSTTVLRNPYSVPLSNFFIKKIQKIKIRAVLEASEKSEKEGKELINLIIKLIRVSHLM
jgi:hypothetical protein